MKQNIRKLCSLLLTAALVLSTCLCMFGTVSADNEVTIYVSSSGNDTNNGTSSDAPLKTLSAAISKANLSQYSATDTVHIALVDNSTSFAWGTAKVNNGTKWSCMLHIYSLNGKATITGDDIVRFYGPMHFENITNTTSRYAFYDNGNDSIIFGENVTNTRDLLMWYPYNLAQGKDIYLLSDNISSRVVLGNSNEEFTIDGDINITVDNNGTNNIHIGDAQSTKKTTYNGNINMSIKNANEFNIVTNNAYKFSSTSAMQIVNSANIDLTDAKEIISDFNNQDGNSLPYYIINNKLGNADAISFTEYTGIYSLSGVDTQNSYVLVKKNGIPVICEKTNEIDLTSFGSGEYSFELTQEADNSIVYYVSSSGSDDNTGLTLASPLKTIDGAVRKADLSQYGENDTVHIALIDNDASYAWTNSSSISGHINKSTQWNCMLHISSLNGKATVGDNSTIRFWGPVHFENLSSTSVLALYGGKDIVFGKNATIDTSNGVIYGWVSSVKMGKDIYLSSDEVSSNYLLGNRNESATQVDGDINITVDNNGANTITIGDPGGNYNAMTKYNGKINFNIKNANTLNIETGKYTFGSESAIGVINSTGIDLTDIMEMFASYKNKDGNSLPYYIINNKLGNKEAISFTDTAGIYSVSGIDTAEYTITVKKDGITVLENLTAQIDLSGLEFGEYTVETVKRTEKFVTYYVSSSGDDTNAGTTAEAPLKTIDGAIQKANLAQYSADTTVHIKLIDANADYAWYNSSSKSGNLNNGNTWQCKLYISSLSDKATIGPGVVRFWGPTYFENVNIKRDGGDGTFGFYGEGEVTFGKNLTFNSYYNAIFMWHPNVSSGKDIYLLSDGVENEIILGNRNEKSNINGDINIILDNKGNNNITIGDPGSNGKTNYNGQIRFNIKSVGDINLRTGNYAFGTNSAIQVINSSGLNYTKLTEVFADYTNTVGKNLPYCIINNTTGDSEAFAFTDTVGKYAASFDTDNFVVLVNGVVTEVSDGFITVPDANAQNIIDIVGNYVNDGEKITFYKAANVDLNTVKHTDKDGMLFVGWKKANGSWAEENAEYQIGDILTAQYIDMSDFAINQISLTDQSDLKLNMGFDNNGTFDNVPNVSENGVIWEETSIAKGRELRVDEGIVTKWDWDLENKDNFYPQNTIEAPNKAANSNIASIAVAADGYNAYYTARGYVKYTDNNGIDRIFYTVEESTSAYKVACEAADQKTIYETIIAKVEADNKLYVDGIEETVVATYDKNNTSYKRNTDSYDVFSNVTGAGEYIERKRTTYITNTGLKETINLGWLTDMHLFDVNQTDVDKGWSNALATYRGSKGWAGNDISLNRAINQISYTNARYKKTIVTGDITDIYANGTFNAVKAIVGDSSVNGSILMTTGNHEFMEYCNTDIDGLSKKFSVEEKYGLIREAWANDPTYYAEILKTTKGEDNAMIILLDNGASEYYAGTAQKLQASLSEAKNKNIPVLIFQHQPMATYNETETKVYWDSETTMGFATEENGKGYYNMSTYNSNLGPDVQEIIRKNYDVIKGVFVGHEHVALYTEITALDESGNIIPDTYIPQFAACGYQQLWVNEIVVEANDDGWVENDINGDGEFDICDLVYADENIGSEDADVIARADKDGDKVITEADIKAIRKILLNTVN